MNFQELETELSVIGTVDYCGYNGENTNSIIIAISDFNNTSSNVNAYNNIISNRVEPTHPKVENLTIHGNIIKADYRA